MCGLYIHIPFCVKKCKYCDFNSFCNMEDLFEDYFLCLKSEIARIKAEGVVFDTVYFGGGTPTAVPNYYLTDLIKAIDNRTNDAEITVECNPGTVSKEDLENLKKSGATRLSIGMQSTDDDELKKLGRIHNLKDFEDCYRSARDAGFDNISIDIMFGLPDQTKEGFLKTLKKAVSYGSEHISVYALKIEDGTPFSKMQLNLPDDDESADMYELCVNFLAENGYDRYEISNFCRDNKISKHNTKYWQTKDYIGIGAGAYSCYKNKRFSMTRDVSDYIKKILSGESAEENIEPLTQFDQMSEFVFLGLRMVKGISEKEFEKRFGKDIFDVFGKELEKYINLEVMERQNGRIYIKSEFLYVSNSILSDFV